MMEKPELEEADVNILCIKKFNKKIIRLEFSFKLFKYLLYNF